jgi:hypothetical protein
MPVASIDNRISAEYRHDAPWLGKPAREHSQAKPSWWYATRTHGVEREAPQPVWNPRARKPHLSSFVHESWTWPRQAHCAELPSSHQRRAAKSPGAERWLRLPLGVDSTWRQSLSFGNSCPRRSQIRSRHRRRGLRDPPAGFQRVPAPIHGELEHQPRPPPILRQNHTHRQGFCMGASD